MEKIYKATAVVSGGRNGHVKSGSGVLDLELRPPKELGGEGGSFTNPEELFAAGYAACFNSAIMLAARRKKLNADDGQVTAHVSIGRDSDGASYKLEVHIEADLPGMTPEEAEYVMDQAHDLCPYSKATRGNIETSLSYKIK